MAALRFPVKGKELTEAEALHLLSDPDGAVRTPLEPVDVEVAVERGDWPPQAHVQSLIARVVDGGVAFSTGSACHEGQDAPNHVLQAIGLGRRRAREVVRFSVCPTTRFDEIDEAVGILLDEAERLRAMAPSDPRGGARRKG